MAMGSSSRSNRKLSRRRGLSRPSRKQVRIRMSWNGSADMTDFLSNLWSKEEGQDIAEYAVMCWLATTNRVSRSASFCRSQAKISSILPSTNRARRRLNFGGIGGFLVSKFVKPTKVLSSWPSH